VVDRVDIVIAMLKGMTFDQAKADKLINFIKSRTKIEENHGKTQQT
jgi:hypothetical protein